MLLNIILLIIGLVLLTKGADLFVDGASSLARKFHIPQIIIGLTIVAMGTSAPEASVSIASAIKGASGVAIGNVLGSNIANILLILGLTSAICNLKIQRNSIIYEMPFLLVITAILGLMGYYIGSVNRICGFIFLLLFLVFMGYLFKMAKNSTHNQEEEETKQLTPIKMVLFIIAGLVALVYGSDLTVNSAISIAHILNISDRIIGLTIVAIGTSLPELVTCVVAAIKKQPDLAVGNIIGSNIFNILFVLGVTCAICPVPFDSAFYFDGAIAFLSIILLWIFTVKDTVLSRGEGIILTLSYIGYMLYLIIK
ncbi:calcium/sodium antiporter [bacterium]|nr:calcium/sodium antiporter [bacterium]